MRSRALIYCALILFSIPVQSFGQMLKGKVLEQKEETLKAVPGAHVYWKGNTDLISVTDSDGKFEIKRGGKDTLVVSIIGFEPYEQKIEENDSFVQIVLRPKVLKSVVIQEGQSAKKIDRLSARGIKRFSEQEFTKAACCNLSESFENISAVDVTTSDAVTGIRQIQMMGFSGIYVQTQVDNMPFTTGLLSASGLTYIPGIFVKSMQLSKGVGSVTNGYEGMTGSLNIEIRKPFHEERLIVNGYFNPMNMRPEGNIIHSAQVSNSWATTTYLHGSGVYASRDVNNDGIQDFPTQNNLQLGSRWLYMKDKWEGTIGFRYFDYGQEMSRLDRNPGEAGYWSTFHGDKRTEVYGMLGHIFKKEPAQSLGFRFNAVNHQLNNRFGERTYQGDENSIRANLVYNSIVKNTFHNITAGLSFYGLEMQDLYVDSISNYNLNLMRKEIIPGAFLEWTESSIEKLTLVFGLRTDLHNHFGWIVTPRFHGKWDMNKNNQLRFSGGRGQRTASPFSDYQGLFAVNRRVYLPSQINDGFYGLQQEVSWNTGVSHTWEMKLFHRPATLVTDYFYTWFDNQLVVDRDYNAGELHFYDLADLFSHSHSFSTELDFSPARRVEIRMAYRFIDARSQYMDGVTRFNPLVSPHRAFVNTEYTTKNDWSFDLTVNWQSPKRLPQGAGLPEFVGEVTYYSPSYTAVMGQIMKKFGKKKNTEIYVGGENLLNIMQQDLIRMASDPNSTYFDPTLIWGPSLGAMFYMGFRYYIRCED